MMHNAKLTIDGNIATITVDMTKELGPSSTKKTILVAKGRDEHDGIFFGINAYRYPARKTVKLRKKG